MKKMLCALVLLFVCTVVCGCSLFTPLPHLSDDEKESVVIEEGDQLHGVVTEVMRPGVLTVSLWPHDAEEWGNAVYVVTLNAGRFSVGDDVMFKFHKYDRPIDSSQYVRIYADSVEMDIRVLKPIIYLYPEEATRCSVHLELDGELTCTYPEYGANGWRDFTAYPDGTLVFPDDKEYYALYWEGSQRSEWDFSRGFCVRGEDTAQFLEWALSAQGLSPREANEFIVYWLPLMQENEFNVISFQEESYTDGAALKITPTPDSTLRVFMAYYPSETEVEIEPQELSCTDRQGFTVVEWGGSCVDRP